MFFPPWLLHTWCHSRLDSVHLPWAEGEALLALSKLVFDKPCRLSPQLSVFPSLCRAM